MSYKISTFVLTIACLLTFVLSMNITHDVNTFQYIEQCKDKSVYHKPAKESQRTEQCEDKDVYHKLAMEPQIIEDQRWFDVTQEEYEKLAKLVHAEAGSEPFDCKTAVLSVVFNRSLSTGNTITDVIYYQNNGVPAFSVSSYLDNVTPTEEDYLAVDYVLEYGCTIPPWVQYFRAGSHHNWSKKYEPYCVIGNTYFGGFNL